MAGENWDDYRFVLALCREGSVAGAARVLGVDGTTVTRRLAQTERALGARLFERERGRVRPTAAARATLTRLAGVDDSLRALRDEIAGADREVAGTVAVTAVPMIANRVLVPRPAEILRRHERLEIELVVDSALLGITRRQDADIAIRSARPDSEPDAVTRKIGDMSYGVYCHRDLLARGDDPGWIAYTPRSSGNISRPQASWIDERIAAEGGVARTRVNDGESLLRCALAGLGRTLLADALARRYPALARLEPPLPDAPARAVDADAPFLPRRPAARRRRELAPRRGTRVPVGGRRHDGLTARRKPAKVTPVAGMCPSPTRPNATVRNGEPRKHLPPRLDRKTAAQPSSRIATISP